MDTSLTPEERREVFGDFDPSDHSAEVAERWGNTEAYRQSATRARSYTKEDWLRINAEAGETTQRLAAAFTSGVPAADPAAMNLAEEHRQHITRWFYDCPKEMHARLGDMYVADPRFTATYESVAPGLAAWLREAMAANASRP